DKGLKKKKTSQLMQEFGVGSSTIYDVKAQKADLMKFMSGAETSKAIEKCRTLHKPKSESIFSLKHSKGVPISGPMLMEKDFYQQMKVGWLACFKMQHSVRTLHVSREKHLLIMTPQNNIVFFKKLVGKHDVTQADETGLFWCCLLTSTLPGVAKASAPGFKRNKDHITLLTCANAAGTHNQLLVVLKFKQPTAFKGIVHLPVEYKAPSNVWIDCEEIVLYWFFHIFVSALKDYLKELGVPADTKIWFLDNCQVHPSKAKLVFGNIFMVFLPANVTSLTLPMNWGIIKNLKVIYRRDFMGKQLNSEGTIQKFQSWYSIKDAVFSEDMPGLLSAYDFKENMEKLWVEVIFVEGSSDEEEFQGFNIRPKGRVLHVLQ
uniref:Uncharacterized protein n=1 Tax=Pelodiscus sinensis TaxID=13735 RepID=K7G919_PELSI